MTNKEAHSYLEDLQRKYTRDRHLYKPELIEANGLAILSLEKQIAKKPIVDKNWCFSLLCPNCRTKLVDTEHCWDKQKEMIISHYVYCSKCGQSLDWSDFE